MLYFHAKWFKEIFERLPRHAVVHIANVYARRAQEVLLHAAAAIVGQANARHNGAAAIVTII